MLGSHASVLLRFGLQTIGVLSLDWEGPGAGDPVLVQELERLAGRYAQAIKAFSTDELFARLDAWLARLEDGPGLPDLRPYLRLVGEMLGVSRGSLLLRRSETGLYHIEASLAELPRPDRTYAPGEGLSGWVVSMNRPLRLADLSNPDELAAVAPAVRGPCEDAPAD